MKTRRSSVHVLACSALFSMGLMAPVSPLHATVESDVVGYTTIEMVADGWYILGSPFAELDDAKEQPLSEFFANSEFTDGDVLYLLSEAGNYMARYWKTFETGSGWNMANIPMMAFDTSTYPSTTAFYIHKKERGTVTFAGKVDAIEVPFGSTELDSSWKLVSLPYPGEKALSEYEWSGCTQGDMLYYVTPDGNIITRYWNVDNNGWSKTPSPFYLAADELLAAGQAVYIHKVSKGLGSVTVK